MKLHQKTLADYYADVIRRINEKTAIEGSKIAFSLQATHQKTEAEVIYDLHRRGAVRITDRSKDSITLEKLPALEQLITATSKDVNSLREHAAINMALRAPANENKVLFSQSSGKGTIKFRDEPPEPPKKLAWKDKPQQDTYAVFVRQTDSRGKLQAKDCSSLPLQGVNADIVEYFCELPYPTSKKPRTYHDMPATIKKKCDIARFGKAIKEVNKRFRKRTSRELGDLIRQVLKKPGYNQANEYYWGL